MSIIKRFDYLSKKMYKLLNKGLNELKLFANVLSHTGLITSISTYIAC